MRGSIRRDPVLSKTNEKLAFLNRTVHELIERYEVLRNEMVEKNELAIESQLSSPKEVKDMAKSSLTKSLQDLIKNAKKTSATHKSTKKIVEDPRGGVTRRFANYIPIKRYQYSEDSSMIFFPNVADKYHDKLEDEWEVNKGAIWLKNTINDDLILWEYMKKFGENEEDYETYKEFRGIKCDNKYILQRYKVFSDLFSKRRANFIQPGCSAKVEEGLNEFSIIKTHKELFCRRCEVYDCGVHGILGISNFVHPDFPSPNEMVTSFDLMVELVNNVDIQQKLGKKPCGPDCFMSFDFSSSQVVKLDGFTIAKIKLGLQVFKFEPCNVRLYCDKDEVTCAEVYQYFKQEYNDTKTFPEYYSNMSKSTPISKTNKKPKNKKSRKHHFINMKHLEENFKSTFAIDYQPCYHRHYDRTCTKEEQCCMDESCCCFQRGFCDKYCGCDLQKCKIRRKGCDCKSDCNGKKCPCHSLNAECDPDLCKCCFNTTTKGKTNNCQNQSIYFRKGKKCKIGPSDVCGGLGLFTIESIQKGDFVCTYIGELISWQEAEMREKWNEYDQETYLCTVSDEFVIDAKYRGNKARFINHGKNHANIAARYSFSRGVYHFAFYAKEDIAAGSELLFDYEGGGSALNEQFPWIKNPNPPKNIPVLKAKEKIKNTQNKHRLVPLVSGPKFVSGIKMEFKLNANPKKFRKIKSSYREDEDLETYGEYITSGGYYAYKEVVSKKMSFISQNGDEEIEGIIEIEEEEGSISSPRMITQGFVHDHISQNILTGTFQPEKLEAQSHPMTGMSIPMFIPPLFQIPKIEYGSGVFPIPIYDMDPLKNQEPEVIIENKNPSANYEENLFLSMMNPVLPKTSQALSGPGTVQRKSRGRPKQKPKVIILGGDDEQDAIILE